MTNLFLSSKYKIAKIIIIIFFLSTTLCLAADTLTVAGIKGLIFQEKDSDYKISITSSFRLHEIILVPNGINLEYTASNKTFKMYGKVKIVLESDSISVSIGDSLNPGIIIKNRILEHVNLNISTIFKLKEVSITPNNLTFAWNKGTYQYKMYGAIEIEIASQKTTAHLGTEVNPGIEIDSAMVRHINIGLSGNLKLKSLSIKPKDLSLIWDKDSTVYKMYGDVFLLLSKDSLNANLGTSEKPGVVISNGILTRLDINLTGDFELGKLTFRPKSLTFDWNEALKRIKIYGNAFIKIEKDSLSANLGIDAASPGIQITDGVIDTIDVKVTGNFTIKSLSLKPDSLAFIYDEERSIYKIFGAVELDIEKDTIKAQLGSFSNPGISIIGGKVDHINLMVTSKFELKKLTIETDSLGIEWYKDPTANVFHFFGKIKIDIDSNKINFDFGTQQAPGLVFRNGKIDTLIISTTDDIHFAGFEVGTQDLKIEYYNNIYNIYGKLFLKKMWSAQIDLGDTPGSGVTLDLTNKPAIILINKANFSLADIDLGPITLKNLELDLEQNKVQMAKLKVKLPPGWDVDAMMGFKFVNNHLEIDSIDLAWEAEDIKNSIEIPGTGAFVMKLEGGLYGIEDPHSFIVKGDIGLAVGGAFNIPDVGEVAFLYLEAGVSISRSEFKLSSSAKIGAYKDKNDQWIPVLGDGSLDLNFKWGNSYSINGTLNIPSGNWTILRANLDATISESGSISADIGVHLKIPPKIPIVGGKEFAEAQGIIRYDKYDPASYVAGWAKINLGFFKLNGGVKYNFQTKDYVTLGAKEIKNISSSTYTPPAPPATPSTPPSVKYLSEYIKINVDESPNYVQVKILFNKRSTRNGFYIEVDNPLASGKSNLSPFYYVTGTDLISQSGINITTVPTFQLQAFYNLDSLTFYIMAPGYKDNMDATLPNAEYTVSINHFGDMVMINSFEVHQMFHPPYANWTIENFNYTQLNSSQLQNMLYTPKLYYKTAAFVYNNDTAVVNLFYTKHLNDNGTLIKTVKYSDYWGNDETKGECLSIENIDFPQNIEAGDSLFIYYTIDDMVNSVFKSPVQYCSFTSPFIAFVNITGMPDSLASGIETKLYIQNPSDNNWYMPDSLTRFTNKNGQVSFPYSVIPNTKIKYVFDIPVGYEVDPASAYQNGEEASAYGANYQCGKQVSIALRKKICNGDLYVR